MRHRGTPAASSRAKRRRLDVVQRLHVPRRRLAGKQPSSSWEATASTCGPPGMQHTAARMQEFRKSMRPLMFFSSGGLLNAEFFALTDISEGRQVRPGDYLHFPGLKSLACVVELRSKGVAECLFFDPSLACKCGAERCWRLRLSIKECEVEIPSGCKFGRALTSAFGQLTSGVVCPWSVCYHETVAEVEPTLSRDRVDLVRSILEATTQDFSGALSAFAPRVVGMYNAATTQAVVLQASDGTEVLPMCCSASTMAGECDIAPRGWQNGVRSISAMGVHRLRKRQYRCHAHGVEWAIADLPGDRVGSFQIRGEYWPGAIWLFEETECFEALRRALEQATQDSVVSTLATHPSPIACDLDPAGDACPECGCCWAPCRLSPTHADNCWLDRCIFGTDEPS